MIPHNSYTRKVKSIVYQLLQLIRVIWKKPRNKLLALCLCFPALWQIFGGSVLFPKPSRILSQVNLSLTPHILHTLRRVSIALIVGITSGFLVGCLVYISKLADAIISKPMAFLMPVPGIALVPLGIVLLGFGNITIVSIGILAAFFPVAYNTFAGLKTVPMEPIEASRIDGACQRLTFTHIELPLALPVILMGIRLSLARCWRTVIATEFIAAASYGIGYYIWDSAEYLQMDKVYCGILIMAVLFLFVEKGIGELERVFTAWI